ncbi:MAG: FCD domain-containing protein [Microbacterium enclense]
MTPTSAGADEHFVAPALSGVSPLSMFDAVRARLYLAIELGLLTAGDRLPSDARSAEALDVSVATIRRAFGALAEENVLVRKRGRHGGTFVADDVDPTRWAADPAVQRFRDEAPTVRALINERALIESALAAEAAWRHDDPATTVHLREARTAIEAATAAEDWTEFHAADVRFHRAVSAASGQEWALAQHRAVADALYAYFVPYPIAYLRESNAQHLAVVEAIERGDAERAAHAARTHVLELRESMFIAPRPSGSGR